MATFSSVERCCLSTTTTLADRPTGLPLSLFPPRRLALDTRDRHVQENREQSKDQRRTLNHNLHGEATWYIVPYAATQGPALDIRPAPAQNRRTPLARHTRASGHGRLAFRDPRTTSLRPGMAAAGGCDGTVDTDGGGAPGWQSAAQSRAQPHCAKRGDRLHGLVARFVDSPAAPPSRFSAGAVASRHCVVGGQRSRVRVVVLASGCRRPQRARSTRCAR